MIQFQLQDFAFDWLHFRRLSASPPESSQPVEINQKIQFKGNLDESQSQLSVSLSVEIGQTGLPFEVSANLVGMFKLSEIPKPAELDQIVHVNCAAILFPFIREAIAELTRKGGIGPLLLPPVNFVALYQDNRAKLEEAKAQV